MNKSDKDFSAQDSLLLIRSMIETTKHTLSDSSHYFLLWGYAVFTGCVLQYLLIKFWTYPQSYYAWFVTWAAVVVHIYFTRRDSKRRKVTTYIGESYGYLWGCLGISFVVLAVIFMKIGWQYSLPFYTLIYAIGTSVSGRLIKFRPLIIGGGICYVLAALTVFIPYDQQLLLTAASILISYIIPGHLLRNHYRNANSDSNAR